MTNVGWNYKMLNYINYDLLKNYLKNISWKFKLIFFTYMLLCLIGQEARVY